LYRSTPRQGDVKEISVTEHWGKPAFNSNAVTTVRTHALIGLWVGQVLWGKLLQRGLFLLIDPEVLPLSDLHLHLRECQIGHVFGWPDLLAFAHPFDVVVDVPGFPLLIDRRTASLLEMGVHIIENLEIATSPEVHTAIEHLIDEAKPPWPLETYVPT
jgi:hypothetical protein